MNGRFTSLRRKALMNMGGKVTTKEYNSEWELALINLPENKRRYVSNTEVHHLLGALMKQLSFYLPRETARLSAELARKMDEIAREDLRPWSADSASRGVWGGEAVREGKAATEQYHIWEIQMQELTDAYDRLVAWGAEVEAALHESNKPLARVHGLLPYLWVVSTGPDGKNVYTKVTDKAQAAELRLAADAAWMAKRDAKAEARWDAETAIRLVAIDKVMSMSYVDLELPDAE